MVKVSILIYVEAGREDEVRSALQGIEGIKEAITGSFFHVMEAEGRGIIGPCYKFSTIFETADLTDLDLIIKKIQSILGVKKVTTSLITLYEAFPQLAEISERDLEEVKRIWDKASGS